MTDPDDLEPNACGGKPPDASHADRGTEPGHIDAGLAVEIDPALLEAALAAVDRAVRKPVRHAPHSEPGDIDFDSPRHAAREARRPEPPDERLVLLQARLREQAERMLRLTEELDRTIEARAVADAQLLELRAAFRTQSDDFDRFRQRARKEKEGAERVGEEKLLRSFIETAGNVERAWRHAESGQEQLMSGVHMIVEQFRTVLRRAGVERIPAQSGTTFDPEVHEAVLHVSVPGVEPGLIVDEATPGWRLHGRLFQAPRVIVSAAHATESAPDAAESPVTLDGAALAEPVTTTPSAADEPSNAAEQPPEPQE